MTRRTTLLISAVVIAALGAILVFAFASNAKEAAFAGAEPVKVLVATEDIPAGTSGSQVGESTELTSLPDASVPDDALSDLTSVESLLTSAPVYKGQVLIPSQFAGADNTTAFTRPAGTVARSVELEAPQRVADFVTPGSEVAIYAVVKTSEFSGEDEGTVSNLLLPRVKVVAVAQSTLARTETEEDSEDEDVSKAVLTVAVDNEQAKRLALAYSAGELHFALLDSDSKTGPGATVGGDNFFTS